MLELKPAKISQRSENLVRVEPVARFHYGSRFGLFLAVRILVRHFDYHKFSAAFPNELTHPTCSQPAFMPSEPMGKRQLVVDVSLRVAAYLSQRAQFFCVASVSLSLSYTN